MKLTSRNCTRCNSASLAYVFKSIKPVDDEVCMVRIVRKCLDCGEHDRFEPMSPELLKYLDGMALLDIIPQDR